MPSSPIYHCTRTFKHSDETVHRTGSHHTALALDRKILRDGIDQTPKRTDDPTPAMTPCTAEG